MKSFITIAAIVIAILNGSLLHPATAEYRLPIVGAALLLSIVVAILSVVSKKEVLKSEPLQATPAIQPPTPGAAVDDEKLADRHLVTLLGLFQEKGRFVDFLMEDVTPYDDAQVGAVGRVVHQGCREVLREYFKVTPVVDAAEGASVTVPAGFSADEYRLVGKISGEPPFSGTLVHKGWKTASVKLPRSVSGDASRLPAIAPAEVELG